MNKDNLISCGKHDNLPCSILCMHLMVDPTLEWIPIEQEESSQYYDYICPECDKDYERMMDQHDITKLRIACVNCVDDIRRVFDKNYEATSESDAKTMRNLPVQRKIPVRESERDAD